MTSVPIIALISVPMIAYRVRMYALLPKSDQDRPPGRSPSDSPPMIVRDTRPLTPRVAETLEKQVIQAPGENPRPDRPARESPTRIDFLAEGRTSYAKGDYDRAIVAYNEFIRLEPQDPIGYRELGLSRLGKKQYDRAIHDFDDAIARNPQFAIAYNDRGLAKFRKGQYDTAIDDFTNAISFNPQFFQAYDNRGLVRHHKGQNYKGNEQRFLYIDAVGDFTDAININGRYADAYRHRAAVLRALRNFSLAGEDEDTAKRLDPR